jgi:hypothetical protein
MFNRIRRKLRGYSDADLISARKKIDALKRREISHLAFNLTEQEKRAWSAYWPKHEPWHVPALYYSPEELEKMIETERGKNPLFPSLKEDPNAA